MSRFERWLTLWVFLCIVAGIALGQWLPAPFEALATVVGVLVEVQVMLSVVYIVNGSRRWYERVPA